MTNPTRRIVSLMAFAVVFSVIGQEIKKIAAADKPGASNSAQAEVFSAPAKIILGGTIATALLSLAAETGPGAAEWAEGLATVAAFTALFVNGAPVWTGLNNLLGSKPTSSTATTTPTRSTPIGVSR